MRLERRLSRWPYSRRKDAALVAVGHLRPAGEEILQTGLGQLRRPESRIMKTKDSQKASSAQSGVETALGLIVSPHVSQAANEKRERLPDVAAVRGPC